MREGERSAALTVRGAVPGADMVEKLRGGLRGGRFREDGAGENPAMVVGAADEDFFPWLGMGRREVVAAGELLDLRRRELAEDMPGELAQERVAEAVDALEVPEKEDEPLQMRGAKLAIDAVKRVRDGVGDRLGLKVGLKVENVVAQADDLVMPRFGQAPGEEIYFAWVLREISRNLLADKSIGIRSKARGSPRSCRDR